MVPVIGSSQITSPVAASAATKRSPLAKKTDPSATDGVEVIGASVGNFQRIWPEETSTQ